MKQLLFLLLFPCLALAQYQGNANQKITLGEQTTADGLVFRGVANLDTVTATSKITRANKQDTSAYILLDTVTNLLWHYKIGSNAWTQAGGSTLDTATMLLPYWRSGRFSGVLPVANGGTGASVRTFVDTINTQTVNGAKTFTSAVTATRFNPTANTATGNGMYLPGTNTLGFSTNGTNRMTIDASGNLGLEVTPNTWFTGYTVLQVGESAALFSNTTSAETRITQLANNAYLNSGGTNWIYAQSDEATRYGQVNGEHQWFTASLGTAGNAISFTQAMTLNTSGNVGIGTTSPQSGYKLHVVDSVYIGGRVSAAGYTTRSDYNLKDEIQTLNYGLNEVIQMQPVKYTYKSNGEQQLGFIAQDIGTLIPESVHFDEFMGVDYQSLIPILTKAIQEQQALIKALEQRILNLENK